jgi:hypothetical protein
MSDVQITHPFDLDSSPEELDLFAEEVGDAQRHHLPPNSLSTLGCECDISTFFCYGCGAESARREATDASANLEDFESALKWARTKMNTPAAQGDKVAEVLQTAFRRPKGG